MHQFNRRMVSWRFGPEFFDQLAELRGLLSKKVGGPFEWAPELTKTRVIEIAVQRLLYSERAATSDNVAPAGAKKPRARKRIDKLTTKKRLKKTA